MCTRTYKGSFKIARPDSSQNFMNTAKTVDLTRLYMQINNTIVFFSNHTHTHTSNLLRNPKQTHVNSKPKVHQFYGVTP